MRLPQAFITANLPKNERSALPPGWYEVQIEASEYKENKSKSGSFIKLVFSVIGETHRNYKIFDILNVDHQNTDAERIAQAALGSILTSVGMPGIEDTEELIGKVLEVQVKTVISEERGEESEVYGYRPYGKQSPSIVSGLKFGFDIDNPFKEIPPDVSIKRELVENNSVSQPNTSNTSTTKRLWD